MAFVRRYLAWGIAGLLMVVAAVVIAEHGTSTGHDAAWIAGSVVGVVAIGIIVVGLVRLVWVRGLHRGSRIWTAPALLAAGLVSLIAASANAQSTGSTRAANKGNTRSVAADAASCLVRQQSPLLMSPPGFDYEPLSAVQSTAIQKLNASVGSGGSNGDFLTAKNLARSGHVVALVIGASGAGYDANRNDFVQGLVVQDGANPQSVTRSELPGGRRLITFTRNPISTAITFSDCYAVVVEAGDPRIARAVANLLP